MTAQERWAAFLGQIEERHRAVCDEALQAGRQGFTALESGDTRALSNGWSAAEARLQELEGRIIDTWHAQVDDAFSADGASRVERQAGWERGDALAFTLANRRDQAEHGLFAEAARHLFARALGGRRDRFCRGCGQPLTVPVVFRAVDLTCPACAATTPFEPGELLRAAAAVGTHALAREAARAEWLAMRTAERQVRLTRPPCPLRLVQEHERAQLAYWTRYLGARAQVEPELGYDLAREVSARMEPWYRDVAEYHPEWVRAGRPRAGVARPLTID